MADIPWKDAIARVLSDGETRHYAGISELIVEMGLRKNVGATPANTVATVLSTSISTEGPACLFMKVGRGLYCLRGPGNKAGHAGPLSNTQAVPDNAETTTGVVQALGMFWDRANVTWTTNPKLLGRQQEGSVSVDFCQQKGVYMLHDSQGVVYVGRATDQGLGRRLQQHTVDRLNGRWDRFSWFGIFSVEDDGKLKTSVNYAGLDSSVLIATMEAILIEGLEPRLNRKRGDDFMAVEFIQVLDPQIEQDRALGKIQQLLNRR